MNDSFFYDFWLKTWMLYVIIPSFYIVIYNIYNIYYIYIILYIYIYICLYKNCVKKRRLYTTKVSCSLQSSGILFVPCSKNKKNICQNQYIKNTSSNEIKKIWIQYQSRVIVKDILFPFKAFQQQFNFMSTSTN